MASNTIDTGGYRVGTRTDIGHRRKRNEDFLGVEKTRLGMLLVVCDGMGGHVGGERASRLAVETFSNVVRTEEGDAKSLLRRGVTLANQAVFAEAAMKPELDGMGTTLVAALVEKERAIVANVGDSRAYLIRAGVAKQITRDHSLVGELVAQGKLTEAAAAVHPQRNIITRALGSVANVEPDTFELTLRDGDTLLLASDGLHGMISNAIIGRLVAYSGSPEQACDALVQAALDAGGHDNVTVALLRFGSAATLAAPVTEPDTAPPHDGARRGGTPWPLVLLAIVALAAGWYLFGTGLDRGSEETVAPDTVATLADSLAGADSLADSSLQLTPGEEMRDTAPAAAIPRDSGAPPRRDTVVRENITPGAMPGPGRQ